MRVRKTALIALLLLVAASVPPPAGAGPYDQILCPMIRGEFFLQEGQLWVWITKEDGRPVEKRKEKIANPLDDKSHEVLAKRGPVTVEVHPDKKGGLFVHWGTLADDK